jgi:hypothetical protein
MFCANRAQHIADRYTYVPLIVFFLPLFLGARQLFPKHIKVVGGSGTRNFHRLGYRFIASGEILEGTVLRLFNTPLM